MARKRDMMFMDIIARYYDGDDDYNLSFEEVGKKVVIAYSECGERPEIEKYDSYEEAFDEKWGEPILNFCYDDEDCGKDFFTDEQIELLKEKLKKRGE